MITEPEEIVESHLVALLEGAANDVAVLGALAPSAPGTEKAAPDTHISVSVDFASQDLDWIGPGVPCTYLASVAVRVAEADGPNGALFRDTCRNVRSALAALAGDGCAALSGDGFSCDALVLDRTQTARESLGEDFSRFVKTYTATVKGRFTPPTETQEN